MDLLPVEIRVGVEGGAAALPVLTGPDGVTTTRRIWFAEDEGGVAAGEVPLLDGGVIVRFRTGDGGPDDLTVTLRPCTREQLVGRFAARFDATPFTYRIEQDWSGEDRVLAASLVHDHPPGALVGAVEPGADPAAPIDAVQDQFLHACAPAVPLDGLVALGPVVSTRADGVRLDGVEVDVEAWSVAGTELLEASTRVRPEDGEDADALTVRAEHRQRQLAQAVRERGAELSKDPVDRTRRILTALAAGPRR
ncbi:hypothetical protein [Streptomyces sp. t39]|uniref:hypothetical protein n=1 Tax=Streptomyces sp. t39 TaxID=1828156 RepID=UPI0011CD4E3E|nr:hypothetical protein [Streptomyces sp. t39]TXS57569.1 hypothetical protein EAO77_17040 [Streptomyces sp. t39]